MIIAEPVSMTLKGMLMLGGVLAGAAYLQDKQRRDRAFGRARDMLDKAKSRVADVSRQVESAVDSAKAEKPADSAFSTFGSSSTYR
jgi:hypothetical protein